MKEVLRASAGYGKCLCTIETPHNFFLLTSFKCSYLRGKFGLLSNDVCTSQLEMLGQDPVVSLRKI